ncbi:MAG: hypothetical protein Kow0081_1800 [Candidatus Dojkabacteria bacterium]
MLNFLKIYTVVCIAFIIIGTGIVFFRFSSHAQIAEDSLKIVLNSTYKQQVEKKIHEIPITSTLKSSAIINDLGSESEHNEQKSELGKFLTTNDETSYKKCEGNWVEFPSLGKKISLSYSTIPEWSSNSAPSILLETKNNVNKVIIGHNFCSNRSCYNATTNFGQIIHLKPGDSVSACIDGDLFTKTVSISTPMEDTSTYILNNWIGQDSLTFFTCYGECYDSSCEATKQRWVVGAV